MENRPYNPSGDQLDDLVAIHRAESPTEAMVLRGLLESAGIEAFDVTAGKPLTTYAHPAGTTENDIVVFRSEAEDTKRIIAEYLAPGKGPAGG